MRSRGIQPGFDRGGEFRYRSRERALQVGKERLGDGVAVLGRRRGRGRRRKRRRRVEFGTGRSEGG